MATGSTPATAAGQPGRASSATRYLDGLLIGAAAAAVAGLAWWAAASITEFEQWAYGAAVVGLITGFGVRLGTRRGGLVGAIEAFVLAALAVAATVYFIDRSLVIAAIEEAGLVRDVPLWQGFSHVGDLYRNTWDFDRTQALGWCSAPVVAAAVAAWPTRRAPGT